MSDEEAIRRLMAEYCLGTDTGNTERWASCFTDDVVWDGGAFGRYEGKEACRAFHQASGGASSALRHLNINPAIDVDGDRATVQSYIIVIQPGEGAPGVLFCGFYDDVMVKRDGRWLIQSRVLRSELA